MRKREEGEKSKGKFILEERGERRNREKRKGEQEGGEERFALRYGGEHIHLFSGWFKVGIERKRKKREREGVGERR